MKLLYDFLLGVERFVGVYKVRKGGPIFLIKIIE
jgi:hypothetical protein